MESQFSSLELFKYYVEFLYISNSVTIANFCLSPSYLWQRDQMKLINVLCSFALLEISLSCFVIIMGQSLFCINLSF